MGSCQAQTSLDTQVCFFSFHVKGLFFENAPLMRETTFTPGPISKSQNRIRKSNWTLLPLVQPILQWSTLQNKLELSIAQDVLFFRLIKMWLILVEKFVFFLFLFCSTSDIFFPTGYALKFQECKVNFALLAKLSWGTPTWRWLYYLF